MNLFMTPEKFRGSKVVGRMADTPHIGSASTQRTVPERPELSPPGPAKTVKEGRINLVEWMKRLASGE